MLLRSFSLSPGRYPFDSIQNTTVIYPKGYIWSSGQTSTRFDPEKDKFQYFGDALQSSYDITLDKEGNVWFTADAGSKIGNVDAKTEKVIPYATPTPKAYSRRMKIDSDGIIWFGKYDGGKIGWFDPKTEIFKEYRLPGPQATPYPLGILETIRFGIRLVTGRTWSIGSEDGSRKPNIPCLILLLP
jgi:virginiamycin B lyase